jgi:hypothetical protein
MYDSGYTLRTPQSAMSQSGSAGGRRSPTVSDRRENTQDRKHVDECDTPSGWNSALSVSSVYDENHQLNEQNSSLRAALKAASVPVCLIDEAREKLFRERQMVDKLRADLAIESLATKKLKEHLALVSPHACAFDLRRRPRGPMY